MKKGINIFGFLKDFFVNNCLFREKITLRELIILNVLVYAEAFQKYMILLMILIFII